MLMTAVPPLVAHGTRHGTQSPETRRAPATTALSFSITQPVDPWSTRSDEGTGPAPISSEPVAAHASLVVGLVSIANE